MRYSHAVEKEVCNSHGAPSRMAGTLRAQAAPSSDGKLGVQHRQAGGQLLQRVGFNISGDGRITHYGRTKAGRAQPVSGQRRDPR
jgi:hypothetical protein